MSHRRTGVVAVSAVTLALTAAVTPAQADTQGHKTLPTSFALPDGFRPEGIATGPGPYAYVGSLADGDIYRADLRTGKGSVVIQGPGTSTVGIKTDRSARLFASGGGAGDARVIDLKSGKTLATYKLGTGTTFINDVVLTRKAAWFTDSATPEPALYKLALGHKGNLPATAEKLKLTGDLIFNPTGPNTNGITETPDGKSLIVVQSNTGKLFKVNPKTGTTKTIDLGGESVPNGDGLLLKGQTLYVVQNRTNAIAVLKLNKQGTKAKLLRRITDPRLDVPTTAASFRGRLYLPNARFTTPPTPTTQYTVNAIPQH